LLVTENIQAIEPVRISEGLRTRDGRRRWEGPSIVVTADLEVASKTRILLTVVPAQA